MIRERLNGLSGRDRRALIVLLLGGLLFVVLDFGILPLVEGTAARRTDLALKEKTLRKYRAVAQLAGPKEAGWQAVQGRLAEAEKGLLTSRAPALASAELREYMKQLLSQHGLESQTIEFLPPRPLAAGVSDYVVIPVSVAATGTLDQVVSFLSAARSSDRAVGTQQLTIEPAVRTERARKTVYLRVVVEGLMKAEASTPESASD